MAAGVRLASAVLWRSLCLGGKLAVVLYFIFCLLFLGLRYLVMPGIDRYKPQVEQLASDALGQKISIAGISASWSRFTPHLQLTDVVLHDSAGQAALRLPQVGADLSWWSVVVGQLRLDSLEIIRPDLDIRRDADGRLFVAGIFIDTSKSGNGRNAEWVLAQHRIVIRDGRVRWRDAQRNAPELLLDHVNFRLENRWQQHAFALSAQPPAALAAPLDLRGIFHHPRFARRIADVSKWTGTLYADVRSPALAAWRPYLDYPIALDAGSGAVRSWLFYKQQKVADLTADLQLADVTARLAPALPLLELTTVRGRISLQEELEPDAGFIATVHPGTAPSTDAPDGKNFFGTGGHTVALTDFSMRTRDGLELPTTTISEKYTPPRNGKPEEVQFFAKLLDLQTLANFVERLPLPAAQRRMLQDFSPQGTLRDFTASWQGTYPALSRYAVKGSFSKLSLQAQAARATRARTATTPAQAAVPAIPGFENLTGSIDANETGGTFRLASSGLKLHLAGYFAEPLVALDQLSMQARWRFETGDRLLLEVAQMQFARQAMHGTLSGSYLMPLNLQRGKPLGTVDLTANVGGLELAKINDYLPLATPEHLRTWLTGALIGGMLQDTNVRLKGDLSGFPYHQQVVAATGTTGSAAGISRPAGEFSVVGQIENGRLDVAPGRLGKDGKAPQWPHIEAIVGRISFDRTRMEIDAKSAQIHNVAVTNVKAVIADLLAVDKILTVDGTATGALQELVGFVNDSPVVDWIGRFTEETRATGNAVLGLKLQLPLAHMQETKVQGALQMPGNDVTLQQAIPTLQQTSGRLDFTEKGVTLNGLKANFVGGPVVASGGTQRDGAIVIRAEGTVSSDGLRRTYATPAIQRLADHVTGSSRYNATIAVRKKHLEITVDSTLQGVALDLPAPLKKPAADALPLKFEIAAAPGDDSGLRDEIRLTLGTALAARYQRQKSTDRNAAWRVVRGGIGVNVPPPQPDSGVNINVSLKTLNIDAWRSLIAAITGPAGSTTAGQAAIGASAASSAAAPATATATGAGAIAAASLPVMPAVATESAGLDQYLEPEVISARAGELIVAGKKLDNVVVGVSHQKGVWQANIDAAQASGYVTWNQSQSGPGLGKVTARLASLIIPKSAASDVTEILEGKNATTQIPALDIIAENFELYGKKMGRLELAANNARSIGQREWRINKLLLSNADAELKATGSWSRADSGDSLTNLAYRLEVANAGKLLERFGFANVLKGGKGLLEGDIRWQGLPFALDVPTLDGQMRIDMAAGQFLKVDPGAAKLLGVLSLQSLPRRLTLDFRDVFSEGFAFDGIAGTVAIARGTARTDNLKMRSVNATVIMDGTADIARESQNLHVAVIPEINVGTASVVYALAVNPVIGLGSFLAQLFLRDPLMRAFTFEYRITGPWSAPEVVKVNRRTGEAQSAPAAQTGAG
ncbi:MAG: TIGR02099 family protein [Herminiimonas sp.]|nr:TIGR02099 family protein [Herminiimonas sp.]